MKAIELGEWVKGPFANTTIEGFIVNVTHSTYHISVKTIEINHGTLPENLAVGSIHELPKIVVHEFFRLLNREQQSNLILLAVNIGQSKWAAELSKKFYNPSFSVNVNTEESSDIERIRIYSNLLNKFVALSINEQKRLYNYYRKSIEQGMIGQIEDPSQINTPGNFDAVITSVVLIARCREGINYIEKLVNNRNEQRMI
ncbi:hypothetical protein [Priestia megaterium]|uniref:hypothetical protein n=1 Tax=Priestia megaterium TaxID=1404 RepID=UPI000BFCD85F|nr:hypothetical protein [Priestia megaterium]PGQ88308.1 hypothetical protein COA18_05100 [Priestia megaterium]